MRKIISLILVLNLTACEFPRGESKSLSDVLKISQERYAAATKSLNSPEINTQLSSIEAALNELIADPNTGRKEKATQVASALFALVQSAGQTSRPALYELAQQFVAIAKVPSAEEAQLKLLASRTLSALASEAETTGFSLKT